ncbi:ankyrin repeat protein, putative [Trichomonas vaginalis G3]|uniref:Ankyrin repeat protein, putative n=1 Tax=Trichomonas vaginalis (strain ATCC PRA-98 / G3) TaxID=412133 RepID=A2E6E8_TRIV3|nr:spectrin binding [Trichomonas vaginalis G3]EAY11761.1 ankyrin repeat protein, putative [Trichomonas vaginalis G3]KAI5540632.1 spectrin binding [Trichomonas vaginalis G3]|eukprot:XP_001323984.1 ankyrin repeat protein [Trichomonas vaginalis G3]
MSSKYIKQYEEYIETYERLFHIKSNESIEDTMNMITNVLISKYQIRIPDLILSLMTAIQYNSRSIDIYVKIINQILSKYTNTEVKTTNFDDLINYTLLTLIKNENKIYQFEYDKDEYPKEDDVHYFIMNDQIDNFKEYLTQNSLEDIDEFLFNDEIGSLSALKACRYFGSVNIFNFLIKCCGNTITQECLELASIGGNIDIINECLKENQIDEFCFLSIIASHNNKFLEFVFERDLYKFDDFNFDNIIYSDLLIYSQNLKAVFLMFEKDKNSILPWASGFPQSREIFKNEDLDFSTYGKTSLNIAAQFNNTDICKFLLDNKTTYKIDINIKRSNHINSIYYATDHSNIELVKLLISHGAKIILDDDGIYSLNCAAAHNNIEIGELLISNGADVNEIDENNLTALHDAASNNSKEFIELLLSHGAIIDQKDEIDFTPLHRAVLSNSKEAAEVLISHGASLIAQSAKFETPLHLAISLNNKEMTEFLVLHGAKINACFEDIDPPLTYALSNDCDEIVQFLISYGADCNIRNVIQQTPIFVAIFMGDLESTKLLISHGADINAKDMKGRTVLHYAVKGDQDKEILDLLISNGVDVNAKDAKYLTPLDYAVKTNNTELEEFLISHGANVLPRSPHIIEDL